jgi:hypothetical protein
MKQQGYGVVPVNPTAPEVLGDVCYPSLESMPDDVKCSVDIVQIFRPSKDVGPIVDEAIRMKKRFGCPRVIWTQLGIVDEDAACRAREAGMEVVMDKCMLVEHRRITVGRP